MRIIIEDFDYKGHRIERCGCEFPQLKDIDAALSDRMLTYMSEILNDAIKSGEG